jgi:cobaltochelatase CobN
MHRFETIRPGIFVSHRTALPTFRLRILLQMSILLLTTLFVPAAGASPRIALLSTEFVLERKFELMEEAARREGVELVWVQLDRSDDAAIGRALDGADLLIVDTPRNDDQAVLEQAAGEAVRASGLPSIRIQVMTPMQRLRAEGVPAPVAEQAYAYYVSGRAVNHERLFRFLKAFIDGGDLSSVLPPSALPDGGIYHPAAPDAVHATLPDYLAWWSAHSGRDWKELPVIGMEMSSSYIADGQTRMLDETVLGLEKAGAVPLVFYRTTRLARRQGQPSGRPPMAAAQNPAGFPNPKAIPQTEIGEPVIELEGRLILDVLMVNTFLGSDPEARKAWHRAMDIPILNVINYRTGNRAEYLTDPAGIGSFFLPFNLTTAEYIGLIDPVVLSSNEGGELVPMPEQMDLLIGKAMKLAALQRKPNADKRLALMFWNHPPGEHNQGASNMNVPRSLERLSAHLRAEGYAVEPLAEQSMIDALPAMLGPRYRREGLKLLLATPHWESLALSRYVDWYGGLPATVRAAIEDHWGPPEASQWIAEVDGERRFIIPRLQRGKLIIMPQPPRGEGHGESDEKNIFHDMKIAVHHAYLATYLWVREEFGADAIIHFGTHGSQEWLPGKERGLWAFDDPNLLAGNTPIISPYIVDNIAEAIHVKRRGRGVIISHQTPPFSPAGLSDDFVAINDLIREYRALDEGLVKSNNRALIVEQAVKMNIHEDLGWMVADLEAGFESFLREIEDYLEDLGSAMQPLGLHSFGETALPEHRVSTVMQMLGQSLYDHLGVDPSATFREDYRSLQESAPYRFVMEQVFSDQPLEEFADPIGRELIAQGRAFDGMLDAATETDGLLRALSGRWVDPSYGGDPIRNPDALPTGRNIYGFDPTRVPTRAAWEAGVEAIQALIASHQIAHGAFPEKLAFSLWSTETMRHLGMLEAQILYAMGVRPVWDQGGRVVGMEPIPLNELGRPRIDTVISLTGLYRDQFPNVMEWFNHAIVILAALNEPETDNLVRRNTTRIEARLREKGIPADEARLYALTRIFGNESGDYGTMLPDATLASDQWEEGDGQLEELYLSRMSWAYGPDPARWSQKLVTPAGDVVNVYAEHLRGTSAAVFSRSSNLRGLLDTDHPFEYLGGIAMAVRHLDGESPQLYISNMRDPLRARLQTAERFLSTELRAVYQHPNWLKEMRAEGYAGTLQLLNTINNFWGWQAMDRNVVRDDQWDEFHATYVMDRYELGLKEWFESANPTALAQIAERMLEAVRKGYWEADQQTVRELVETYVDLAERHDVFTANKTFAAYVEELAAGFGLASGAVPDATAAQPEDADPDTQQPRSDASEMSETVSGQVLAEVQPQQADEQDIPAALWLLGLILVAGVSHRAWLTHRSNI